MKRRFSVDLFLKLLMAIPMMAFLSLPGCVKEPGKGGLATITGKVFTVDINALGVAHDSGYGGGVKVSISYGTNDWIDQSTTTSPNGTYAFQGLQKGDYRVFTYSRCETCLLNQTSLTQDVGLTKTREVATLPDFRILQ